MRLCLPRNCNPAYGSHGERSMKKNAIEVARRISGLPAGRLSGREDPEKLPGAPTCPSNNRTISNSSSTGRPLGHLSRAPRRRCEMRYRIYRHLRALAAAETSAEPPPKRPEMTWKDHSSCCCISGGNRTQPDGAISLRCLFARSSRCLASIGSWCGAGRPVSWPSPRRKWDTF